MGNVIRIDGERVRNHLGPIVGGTVEETLNAMLEAEADRLCNAERCEETQARRDQRSGSYDRKLQTKAGEVTLKVPNLTGDNSAGIASVKGYDVGYPTKSRSRFDFISPMGQPTARIGFRKWQDAIAGEAIKIGMPAVASHCDQQRMHHVHVPAALQLECVEITS